MTTSGLESDPSIHVNDDRRAPLRVLSGQAAAGVLVITGMIVDRFAPGTETGEILVASAFSLSTVHTVAEVAVVGVRQLIKR